VSVGLGRGLEGVIWPIVQRLGSGQWNRDLWIASVRYQRAGPIALRVEAGLVPSPVGLANYIGRRPHLNPTIAQPSSLFTSLPALEPQAPRANLLGAVYPFGGQVTLSGQHWYGHAAVIDTSPLRRRRIFSRTNPPRFTNVVVGGGAMPIVGLNIGASVTQGGWMRAGEGPDVTADLDATVITVESEFSIAYTKLAGEWVRDLIETSTGEYVATGWFVQGQQTLAPRWFVAGRVERMSSPLVSVVIPSYNQAEFLPATIQSVLNQTYPDFEVLVSDNASTDDSLQVAKSFADPRIKIGVNACNVGHVFQSRPADLDHSCTELQKETLGSTIL
jgi:hypothetical protein